MNALSKDLSRDVTSLDGLDTLFESDAEVVEQAAALSQADTTHDVDGVLTWSLQDAADNLGLSKRTILRRLKTGALLGQKITGNFGPEWRITPPANGSAAVTPSSHHVTPSDNHPQDRTLDQALSKYAEHLLQLVEEKTNSYFSSRKKMATFRHN